MGDFSTKVKPRDSCLDAEVYLKMPDVSEPFPHGAQPQSELASGAICCLWVVRRERQASCFNRSILQIISISANVRRPADRGISLFIRWRSGGLVVVK